MDINAIPNSYTQDAYENRIAELLAEKSTLKSDLAAAQAEIARTKELARSVCDELEELRSKEARKILGMPVIAHKGEEG